MKLSPMLCLILPMAAFALPACHRIHAEEKENPHQDHHKIVATSPLIKDIVNTQQYVCQIRSRRHIEVRALDEGYLEEILVKEGQAVKTGDVLFRVLPTLYQARLDAEQAKARLAQVKFDNTRRLNETKVGTSNSGVVSVQEVLMAQAELDEANAKANLAKAELNFTVVKAPFDGIIDRLQQQHGSLIKKEDLLTTLSDNKTMWVYFNVPEARYLEYMTGLDKDYDKGKEKNKDDERKSKDPSKGKGDDDAAAGDDNQNEKIELILANGSKFQHTGRIGAIEAKFNNETGNIPFRADFPNPDRLLRHGQTGSVLIHRTQRNAIVIPQRATFEILDKRYVFVVGKDGAVHQREIVIQHEMDDVFVVKKGLDVNDRIILEGVRQVRDGEHVEYEFRKPEEAIANQKQHAE